MSDNVVAIRGGSVESARRAEFLAAVGQSFDLYVTTYGEEPDAVVYVMNGVKQASQIGWTIQGGSEGGAASVLALSATHMMAEAGSSRQGL